MGETDDDFEEMLRVIEQQQRETEARLAEHPISAYAQKELDAASDRLREESQQAVEAGDVHAVRQAVSKYHETVDMLGNLEQIERASGQEAADELRRDDDE